MTDTKPPKVFISYAWEDDIKTWVRDFATRLRSDGVDTILDQWVVVPGDQLPEFMENSVRVSDFVLVVCTPIYKNKSDSSDPSGVGYEKGVITGELFVKRNQRKFIPVLRKGKWLEAAPSWVLGKNYIDLRANPYNEDNYQDLLKTLYDKRESPPPLGKPPDFSGDTSRKKDKPVAPNKPIISRIALEGFFAKLKLILSTIFPFIRFVGFASIAIALFWAGSLAIPKFNFFIPTLKAASTHSPIVNATSTNFLGIPSETPKPKATSTKIGTLTPTSTSALGIGSTMTSDKDGMVMVYVPEGSFTMGNDNGYSHEKPAHKVFLDAYWIDSTEVTNGQYAMCVQSGVCSDPVWQGGYSPDYFKQAEYSNYPMVRINWKEAQSYCQWAGKRLPTEAEWEKAARGTDERIYPWGNNPPSCDLANLSKCINPPDFSPVLSLKTVGSYPEGVSPYKAYDMLGNTWEWVADWFSETYYSQSPERNPTGPSTGQYRILRGGSAYENARVVSRLWTGPKQWGPYYGVRCVKDVSK